MIQVGEVGDLMEHTLVGFVLYPAPETPDFNDDNVKLVGGAGVRHAPHAEYLFYDTSDHHFSELLPAKFQESNTLYSHFNIPLRQLVQRPNLPARPTVKPTSRKTKRARASPYCGAQHESGLSEEWTGPKLLDWTPAQKRHFMETIGAHNCGVSGRRDSSDDDEEWDV